MTHGGIRRRRRASTRCRPTGNHTIHDMTPPQGRASLPGLQCPAAVERPIDRGPIALRHRRIVGRSAFFLGDRSGNDRERQPEFAAAAGQSKMGNTPKGIRTPVAGMKSRCPSPLDDGGSDQRRRLLGQAATNVNSQRPVVCPQDVNSMWTVTECQAFEDNPGPRRRPRR